MPNKLVFAFDMDGVLVDSVSKLYGVYDQFLASFGKKRGPGEVEALNGFKIEQIVSYARIKHDLPGNDFELLQGYNLAISRIYKEVDLMPGADKVLKNIRKYGFSTALVSSASHQHINEVLDTFKIREYFDVVISGDNVKEGKPSPEIYNLLKQHFKSNSAIYVIEDSPSGIKSATAAGFSVITFSPASRATTNLPPTEYCITNLYELERIVVEIKAGCKTVGISEDIQVKLLEDQLKITPEIENAVNQLWEEEQAKNPQLFNGMVLCYAASHYQGISLIVEAYRVPYKYFLAKLRQPRLPFTVAPLAVSGMLLDESKQTIIGKRSKVTEYPGCYELIPSGSLSAVCVQGNQVNFKKQLSQEFIEELVGASVSDIGLIKPVGLVWDKKHQVYDICCKIFLTKKLSFDMVLNTQEYASPLILPAKDLITFSESNPMVPTSLTLFKLVEPEL